MFVRISACFLGLQGSDLLSVYLFYNTFLSYSVLCSFISFCLNVFLQKFWTISFHMAVSVGITKWTIVQKQPFRGVLRKGVLEIYNEFVLVIKRLRGKFGINLPSSLCETMKPPKWNEGDLEISKMNETNFPQTWRINMWFLVNHIWQALNEHAMVRITQKINESISTNLINITP